MEGGTKTSQAHRLLALLNKTSFEPELLPRSKPLEVGCVCTIQFRIVVVSRWYMSSTRPHDATAQYELTKNGATQSDGSPYRVRNR